MTAEIPPWILSLLAEGGNATVLVLGVPSTLFMLLICYTVLFSEKGTNRLEKLIKAWRQREPATPEKKARK